MKASQNLYKFFRHVLFASSAFLLAGCATTKNPVDPYENYNRVVFKFNRGLDYAILRPVADLYDTVIPEPIQGGIGRMYTNFYEPSRVINDILQGEGLYACQDGARFVVNTTVGLVGFFDVAQSLGYPPHNQDFGITMARWGWDQSAFLVVPFLGVYTVRDFSAIPFNSYAFTFWPYLRPESLSWELYFLELIHDRSVLRPTDKVIDEAIDPYLLVRDAYLQKRKQDISIQKSGRHPDIKPAAEQEDQTVLNQDTSPVKEKAAKNMRNVKRSPQKSLSNSLPDVLSLKIPHPQEFPQKRGILSHFIYATPKQSLGSHLEGSITLLPSKNTPLLM